MNGLLLISLGDTSLFGFVSIGSQKFAIPMEATSFKLYGSFSCLSAVFYFRSSTLPGIVPAQVSFEGERE